MYTELLQVERANVLHGCVVLKLHGPFAITYGMTG
jgi:hypothetical protein